MKFAFRLLLIALFGSSCTLFAQSNLAQSSLDGRRLAAMHLAKWQGMTIAEQGLTPYDDIFVLREKDSLLVAFARIRHTPDPHVVMEYRTDTNATISDRKITEVERPFSAPEQQMYIIHKALEADWEDNLGKLYQEIPNATMYRLIMESKGKYQAYVYAIAGAGEMLFGNDYMLTLNAKGKILNRKPLHANVQTVAIEEGVAKTAHTHEKGSFEGITATDILILELYGRMTDWKFHYVVGPKTVDTVNLLSGEVTRVPKAIWEANMKAGK